MFLIVHYFSGYGVGKSDFSLSLASSSKIKHFTRAPYFTLRNDIALQLNKNLMLIH